MHRFWDITELVLSVIHFLSKSDRIRLARVNQQLWKTVTPRYGRTSPIFATFSISSRQIYPKRVNICLMNVMSLCSYVIATRVLPRGATQAIRTSDWDRLVLYSQGTRTLHYTIEKAVAEVPDVIWNHDKLSIAFPNLQSLNVYVRRDIPPGLVDTISRLLRPTLHKVNLSAEISSTLFTFRPVLQRIAQDRPVSLEEISLSCGWYVDRVLGELPVAVRSQRNLSHLRLWCSEDIPALADAARNLPCLSELDLEMLESLPEDLGSVDGSEQSFQAFVTLRAAGPLCAFTSY